jgi:hypothetical protein
MAEKPDEKELVTFKEMLMANSIQVDAVAQLLIEKARLADVLCNLVRLNVMASNLESEKAGMIHNM